MKDTHGAARIYLLGFMGSGKSYSGRSLAGLLDYAFIDLDDRIEARAGQSIGEIFAEQGEAAFRELEATCLRETAALHGAVIACGGGTPCHAGNMAWMKANGLTLFLDPPVEVLVERLMKGRAHRPLIRSFGNRDELRIFIEAKLEARRPVYQRADVHVVPPPNEDMARFLARHILQIIGH